MVVMKYAKNNNLRKNLSNIVKDKWIIKLLQLNNIISGLEKIHKYIKRILFIVIFIMIIF